MPEVQVPLGLIEIAVLQTAAKAIKEEAVALDSARPAVTADQPPDEFSMRLQFSLTSIARRISRIAMPPPKGSMRLLPHPALPGVLAARRGAGPGLSRPFRDQLLRPRDSHGPAQLIAHLPARRATVPRSPVGGPQVRHRPR